ALNLRRYLASIAAARHGKRDGGIPPPPRLKHGRVEKRLHEDIARGRRVEIPEDVGQRKRMLGPERQEQRVFGRRGLQLEVELPAESLAQGQSPRAVDAASEWRMEHELHAAGLIEKPFENGRVLRRQHPERTPGVGVVGNRLNGGFARNATFSGKPLRRAVWRFARFE